VRIAVIQLGLESVGDNESSVYGESALRIGWNSLNMIRLFRKYAFLALSPLGWIELVGLAGS
jgi:hypothetical protein